MKNSRLKILNTLVCISLFASGLNAFAAKPIGKFPAPTAQDAGFDETLLSSSPSEVKAARKLADDTRTYSETDLTPGYKIWRDKFLKATTADQLDAVLAEADTYYDTLSPDVQLLLAEAELIRPFRSIIYRLRPLFEHDKGVQSSSVTSIRSLASSLKIYLPNDQWEAGFAYVTLPSADHDDTNQQFHSVQDFQDFLMSTTDSFSKQGKRISALYTTRKKAGNDSALLWDNQLFYSGGFADGLDRFRVVGNAEMAAALSSVFGTLQAIESFCAYNQDELLEAAEDLGHLAGLNGFSILQKIEGEDIGVSARDRTEVLSRSKYKKFLTLKTTKPPSIRTIPEQIS